MASDPEIEDLQGQIDVLSQKIEDLSDEMGKLEKSSGGFKSNIGDTNNLLGDAVNSIVTIRKEFSKFAVDTQAQYKYAENLAKTSKKTAVNMGMSVGRSQEFTKQFNLATSQLQKFGLEAADVNNIMTEYAEKSGRARILSPDEVLQIGLMERGLGVSAENAAVLYEKMDLMGVSATDASKSINQMVAESQKLGLNASKVAKVLSNNFDSMSTMSFSNGVKGMTKMAQLAVKMRMDVSDMLGMAEKFYEPEAAIEAAANLQMLGGDIAKAFGDPFETMYLARNKPVELAERVGDMVENMMQFNEETGEYEFPAEVRMQLKAAGEQLNMNTDKMIDMARQAAKIKDIKMNVSGNIQDEDMREGLASMARMKDGKWVVDFKGEEIDIGDVGMDKAAEILSAPKDADEAIMDMAYNSMTTNEILKNILESLKTGFVAEINRYEIIEEVLGPSMKGLFGGIEKQLENALTIFRDSPMGDVVELTREQAERLGLTTEEGLTNFFEEDFAEILTDGIGGVLDRWKDEFSGDLSTIIDDLKQHMGGELEQKLPGEGDFLLREDGTKVSFSTEDDIIGAKKGGPLDKLMEKGLPNNMVSGVPSKMEFGNLNISGRLEIVSPDGSTSNLDMSSIKPQIEKMIINQLNGSFRNGGVTSSKERTDYMG